MHLRAVAFLNAEAEGFVLLLLHLLATLLLLLMLLQLLWPLLSRGLLIRPLLSVAFLLLLLLSLGVGSAEQGDENQKTGTESRSHGYLSFV
jgi:hypothetical protein